MNRRQFLQGLAAVVAAGAVPAIIAQCEEAEGSRRRILPLYPVAKSKKDVQYTGAMNGMSVNGDLYKQLTGLEKNVGNFVKVDFNKRLRSLWSKKRNNSHNPVLTQVYQEQVEEYLQDNTPSTMTIDEYVREIEETISGVRNNIDWDKAASYKRLKKVKKHLLKDIAHALHERDMLSYALTELMPSQEGKFNIAVFDFLLRNAGREYVELIPALYDEKVSFGPYQFTEYAIYDAGKEKRGASILNQALPQDYKIPGSVRYVKGNDHHAAAYLFALNNIAEFIAGLNPRQLNTLQEQWQSKKADLVKFIATSHHAPADARKIGKRWLDNHTQYDYTVSCHGRFKQYAQKTAANYNALYH